MKMESSIPPPIPRWPTCRRRPRATSISTTTCKVVPCSIPSRMATSATVPQRTSTRAIRPSLSCHRNGHGLETTCTARRLNSYLARSLPHGPKRLNKCPIPRFRAQPMDCNQARLRHLMRTSSTGCPAIQVHHQSCMTHNTITHRPSPTECRPLHRLRFLRQHRITLRNRRRHTRIMAVESIRRRMGRHRICKVFHMV